MFVAKKLKTFVPTLQIQLLKKNSMAIYSAEYYSLLKLLQENQWKWF